MRSDTDTLQFILEHVTPLPAVSVTLDNALGRVLRRDALSDCDQPPFDRSAMDGYALSAAKPGQEFYIISGDVFAGQVPCFTLAAGQCAHVTTGAMLPKGTVRVLRQEDATLRGNKVRIKDTAPANETFMRLQGEDAREGDVLLKAGQILKPAHIAILASIGITDPIVARTVRVAHVVTGSELVHPLKTPLPGQIRDSNTSLIHALCAQIGVSVRHRAHAIDDAQQTYDLISSLPDRGYDVLLFSGGSGKGSHDFCRSVLTQLGFTLRLEGVAIRPGKPLIFATRGSQLAFGLPGNPISHFVLFHLFVRPVLRALQKADLEPLLMMGTLACDVDDVTHPLKTYRPAHWLVTDKGPQLQPLAWNGSGHLSSLAQTNALLVVPPDTTSLRKGQRVSWLAV